MQDEQKNDACALCKCSSSGNKIPGSVRLNGRLPGLRDAKGSG